MSHYHACDSENCARVYGETRDIDRELFEKTGSAIRPWSAWRERRKAGTAMPEWVLSYLDQCAEVVHELEQSALDRSRVFQRLVPGKKGEIDSEVDSNTARTISVGFGFTGVRGKRSVFWRDAREMDEAIIVAFTARAILAGESDQDAYIEVGLKFGLDMRTIERIWKESDLGSRILKPLKTQRPRERGRD